MTSYGTKEAFDRVLSLYGIDLSVEGEAIMQDKSSIIWQKLGSPVYITPDFPQKERISIASFGRNSTSESFTDRYFNNDRDSIDLK